MTRTLPPAKPATWPAHWKIPPMQGMPAAPRDACSTGVLNQLFNGGKTLGRRVINVAMLLLLLIGAGTVWDTTVGDGSLPQLNDLRQISPQTVAMAQRNSTAGLAPATMQTSYWHALTPSRRLLLSLSPQIALWLQTLHQNGRIQTSEPDDIHQTYHVSTDTPLLAAYRYTQDTLYLGAAFWQLSDGQKVAVITHEYRHYRQNPGKRISHQLAQFIGLGQLQSQSPMETEAMAYEQQAATALGVNAAI